MSGKPIQAPRRIAIIGCSGGGKSTLGRDLADRTGLPLIHLDQEYWRPGWKMPPPQDWAARHATLIAQPRWIIEGTFAATLPERAAAADLVIFLDLPRGRCLRRVLWRVVLSHGRVRADMAPGCPERFDAAFLRYVWTFQKRINPRIEAAIDGHGHVRLRAPREINSWLDVAF
ncbi:MAG: adenylate kinase [Alphaproteobacteria bacterium]|nr:adenylate kinase [Alphaproteobacteria bacterium]